jgi:hypothetical protein
VAVLLPIVVAVIVVAVCVAVTLRFPYADQAIVTTPGATIPAAGVLRPLFVCGTDEGIVVDGLLDLTDTPVGIPTTWRLRGPADIDERRDVLCLLQQWADDDAAVEVDFTALCSTHPSITFEHDGDRFRLALTVRPATARGR